VYDASKQSLVAQLPIRGSHSLDPANRRIFLLDQNAIHAVDMDTFVQLGTEYFSATSKYRPSFTRWGRYGFAFVGAPNHFDAGTLYIGLSRLIP